MNIRRRVPSVVIIPMIRIVDYQSENECLPKAIRLPREMSALHESMPEVPLTKSFASMSLG